jgi:RNA polymerase sigma-70 factor (family 1)
MPVNRTYRNFPDSKLLYLLKSADHLAFDEIHERYYNLVFKEAYGKLREVEQAQDIVQELFMDLWLRREILPAINNLAGYLTQSVKYSIFSFFEHQAVESRYISSLTEFVNTGNIAHTDYLVREKEYKKQIDSAIQSLPGKMREIFELNCNSNLSNKEIAIKLSLSEKTVSAQIINAIARLKTKLRILPLLLLWIS